MPLHALGWSYMLKLLVAGTASAAVGFWTLGLELVHLTFQVEEAGMIGLLSDGAAIGVGTLMLGFGTFIFRQLTKLSQLQAADAATARERVRELEDEKRELEDEKAEMRRKWEREMELRVSLERQGLIDRRHSVRAEDLADGNVTGHPEDEEPPQ